MTFCKQIFFETTNFWEINLANSTKATSHVKSCHKSNSLVVIHLVSQETAMLYAGAEVSPLPLSAILALSKTGSLYAAFSFLVRGVLTILKEFPLTELGPLLQHSKNLFPHR